jgi:hypothetical protein
MSFRFPSLALGSVPVPSFRLGQRGTATVHSAFWAFFSSGFGFFSPARHFPFASSGRGFKHFACTTAFPANPSNTSLNPTCAKSRAVGLAPR